MVGETINRYRVLEKIGEGGMGTVYRARDEQLGRFVALKVLANGQVSDPRALQRFLREARAAASLNHPAICTIYGVEEVDGETFIAMELIEGDSLERLIASSPIALADAVEKSVRIAEGLQYAHSRGVVHRDLKPANILVRPDGRVKIIDFGLARLINGHQTELGDAIAGTIAFMAPEQFQAPDQVDHRADLWALGVMLFEMLAGCKPFDSSYPQALFYSILNDPPLDISKLRPDTPRSLCTILDRLLQKEPEARYQSAGELLQDLRRLDEEASSSDISRASQPMCRPSEPSLVVLPLVLIGPSSDDQYLSDGITEELTMSLATTPGIRVVSRTSAFQYRNKAADVREIGRALGVEYVLEGSLHRSRNRIRINAQLIATSDGCPVWTKRFQGAFQDLFQIQDEYCLSVLANLTARLMGGDAVPEIRTDVAPINAEAHDHYLRGRFLFNDHSETSLRRAIEEFELAASLSPHFSLPHVGIAEALLSLDWYGNGAPSQLLAAAQQAAACALELNPRDPIAFSVRGALAGCVDFDWERARQDFERALAAGPGLAAIRFRYALDFLTPLGDLMGAECEIRRALELDPLSPITGTALAGCYYRLREFERAAVQLRAVLARQPDFGPAHWGLARVLERLGDADATLQSFHRALHLTERLPAIIGEWGHALARFGDSAGARQALDELTALREARYVPPMAFAYTLFGLGETSAALDAVGRAIRERSRSVLWALVDPRLSEPELNRSLRRAMEPTHLPTAASLGSSFGN